MAWKGEPICDWSELPKDQCAHCTGDMKAYDKSLEEPYNVDDPSMWEDDEDE